MSGCSREFCFAPDTTCEQGFLNPNDCPSWREAHDDSLSSVSFSDFSDDEIILPWSGRAMGLVDVGFIAGRRKPFLIGYRGLANLAASKRGTHKDRKVRRSLERAKTILQSTEMMYRKAGASQDGEIGQLLKIVRNSAERMGENLIANALHYRGAVTPHIRVFAERQDSFWLFSVSDNRLALRRKIIL